METNSDTNQYDDSNKEEVSADLQAESCRSCDDFNMRPGMNHGMRPGTGNCGRNGNGRPCGRPNMRPGNMRPGMEGQCGRPGNGRPCGRPGMRPDFRPGNRLPDGWRPSDGMRSNSIYDDSDLHSEWNCKSRVLNTADGVSMVVGCEGQTMTGCHMNDPMERLGDAFPPVMAYVPWQQWGDLYEPEYGLKEGTIFKDLNYIFCGTRC